MGVLQGHPGPPPSYSRLRGDWATAEKPTPKGTAGARPPPPGVRHRDRAFSQLLQNSALRAGGGSDGRLLVGGRQRGQAVGRGERRGGFVGGGEGERHQALGGLAAERR